VEKKRAGAAEIKSEKKMIKHQTLYYQNTHKNEKVSVQMISVAFG
jgi:hypothetical protein